MQDMQQMNQKLKSASYESRLLSILFRWKQLSQICSFDPDSKFQQQSLSSNNSFDYLPINSSDENTPYSSVVEQIPTGCSFESRFLSVLRRARRFLIQVILYLWCWQSQLASRYCISVLFCISSRGRKILMAMFLMLETSKFLLFLRASVTNQGISLCLNISMISSVLSFDFLTLLLPEIECLQIFFLSLRMVILHYLMEWIKGEDKLFMQQRNQLILLFQNYKYIQTVNCNYPLSAVPLPHRWQHKALIRGLLLPRRQLIYAAQQFHIQSIQVQSLY